MSEYVIGQSATVTGKVTKADEDEKTGTVTVTVVIEPSGYVYQEYPKTIEPGVIATSAEHEAEIKAAPKKAADAAAKADKDKAAKDAAAKKADK